MFGGWANPCASCENHVEMLISEKSCQTKANKQLSYLQSPKQTKVPFELVGLSGVEGETILESWQVSRLAKLVHLVLYSFLHWARL